MHWIIQNNLFHERGVQDLIELLVRMDIPHSEHKVIPFVGEIEPDIDIDGPVMCLGSYSMRHLAKKKGWTPGVFDLDAITYQDCVAHWPGQMLNEGAVVCPLNQALANFDKVCEEGCVFMRPITDSKDFAGGVFDWGQLEYMWKGVYLLGDDADPAGLRHDTLVMIARPRNIAREYRTWVVDGKVVTASLYKQGGHVLYSNDVDKDILWYATGLVAPMAMESWAPQRAFVLDVALMTDGSKQVVELNTLNAAGLYAADVGKLVQAIEDMRF